MSTTLYTIFSSRDGKEWTKAGTSESIRGAAYIGSLQGRYHPPYGYRSYKVIDADGNEVIHEERSAAGGWVRRGPATP